jgi:hypothetical protein
VSQRPQPSGFFKRKRAFVSLSLPVAIPDAYGAAYHPQRAKPKTIHEMASRLMARPKVRARIEMLMQPVIERAQLTREEWSERLAHICLADIRRMFDEHGIPIAITKPANSEAAAISAFEVYGGLAAASDRSEVGGGTLRVRMIDQLDALELWEGDGLFCRPMRTDGCCGRTPDYHRRICGPRRSTSTSRNGHTHARQATEHRRVRSHGLIN